jgi:redox-sensitive bicupin YhaK (pirin superfamily)
VVLFDALQNASDSHRGFTITAGPSGRVCAMVFAGVRLEEPIAWHGPIVMNSQREIDATISELRSGSFPPTRAPWNYRVLAEFPPPKL